jgi:hypothetical protein
MAPLLYTARGAAFSASCVAEEKDFSPAMCLRDTLRGTLAKRFFLRSRRRLVFKGHDPSRPESGVAAPYCHAWSDLVSAGTRPNRIGIRAIAAQYVLGVGYLEQSRQKIFAITGEDYTSLHGASWSFNATITADASYP